MVHDFRIRDVLYNNGSTIEPIMYQENIIPPVSDSDYKIVDNLFGRLTKVPYAMLTSPLKESIENVMPDQINLPLMAHAHC